MAASGKYLIQNFDVVGSQRHPSEINFTTENGSILLMDKPKQWSSFDIVKFLRRRVPFKKVGHAGTLDPLATGLLVCCCGKATKTISQFHQLKKVYSATIKFGASTPSYDAATEADQTAEWNHIKAQNIKDVVAEKFKGQIMQKPPIYSAIRVNGKRLYKYARKGQDVDIKARPVTIYDVHMDLFDLPYLKLTITCGKGTYIRSIAHDLGLALDSRAYLSDLRRIKIGKYSVENAFSPETIDSFLTEVNT